MKKYFLYAAVLFLAAYGGNQYNAEQPKSRPVLLPAKNAASTSAKSNGKPAFTDSLMELPGIKPAAVLLME